MPEYAIGSALSVIGIVLAERFWFRSGVFRQRAYWIAMAICLFFMVLTNGWLTKLSAPIVLYEAAMKTPWRFPWDIPIEDYGFGFALLTLVLAGWEKAGRGSDGALDTGSDSRATGGRS